MTQRQNECILYTPPSHRRTHLPPPIHTPRGIQWQQWNAACISALCNSNKNDCSTYWHIAQISLAGAIVATRWRSRQRWHHRHGNRRRWSGTEAAWHLFEAITAIVAQRQGSTATERVPSCRYLSFPASRKRITKLTGADNADDILKPNCRVTRAANARPRVESVTGANVTYAVAYTRTQTGMYVCIGKWLKWQRITSTQRDEGGECRGDNGWPLAVGVLRTTAAGGCRRTEGIKMLARTHMWSMSFITHGSRGQQGVRNGIAVTRSNATSAQYKKTTTTAEAKTIAVTGKTMAALRLWQPAQMHMHQNKHTERRVGGTKLKQKKAKADAKGKRKEGATAKRAHTG